MPGYKRKLDKDAEKSRWRLEVSNGFRADGKPNRASKVVGPCTEAKAEKLLQEFYLEFSKKPPQTANAVTFESFVRIWEARHHVTLSPNTINGMKPMVNGRLVPWFGKMKLNKITGQHIEYYLEELTIHGERLDGKPGRISNGMICDLFKVLRSILQKAVDWRYIPSNPCSDVPKEKRPKVRYKVKKIYEDDELARFLSELFKLPQTYVNIRNVTFLYLALITGCRRGELMALSWPDIDFDHLSINISKDIYTGNGETLVQNRTKGEEPRTVLMDAVAAGLLQQEHDLQTEWLNEKGLNNPSGYVFCGFQSVKGVVKLPVVTSFYTWLRRFCKSHDLPLIDLHGFRRMTASYAVSSNVPVTAIQQMLGHKDVATTCVYLRSLKATRRESTDALASVFGNLLSIGNQLQKPPNDNESDSVE